MRAKEFLTELANAPYVTHMTGVTPPGSSTKTDFYRFTTDAGLDYDIAIQTYKDDSTVSSKPTSESGIRVDFQLASIDSDDERKWAGTEVEGTGDAMRVFATVRKQVLDSIEDFDRFGAMAFAFMKPDDPDRPAKPREIKFIQFQAHSKFPSRVKLYNRVAQSAGKWFPGFVLARGPYSITEHGEPGVRWVLKKQELDEQVQPELTNGEGFEHTVDRNGITLKAASNGHGALQIKAFVQGKKAGEAYFEMTPDNQHIASDDTHVDQRFRRTGIATVMYQYAKELGNSIAPSPDRTDDGNAMWLGFMRKNSIAENFADGRNPQDQGDSARHGVPKKASLNTLDKIVHSKSAGPRKKQLAHWQANMRRGRAK